MRKMPGTNYRVRHFISKINSDLSLNLIKLGVADWNKCFTATPSALKQQAFTGIYMCGYK